MVGTLVALHSAGVQAKARALEDLLGQRLTQIFQFQLDLRQITRLDQAFIEYHRLNPDIAAAALTVVLTGRAQAGELSVGAVSPPDIASNLRKARQIGLDIPLSFFESATFIYDYEGRVIRDAGQSLGTTTPAPGS